MKKKLIVFLIILILIIVGIFCYIQSIFVPFQLKPILISEAHKLLKRPISIEKIGYNPFTGASIQNLVIYEKNNDRTPFLSVHRSSFRILLLPFLKNRQLVIPYAKIQKPYIHLIRTGTEKKDWNFSDMIGKNSGASPTSFFLGDLVVEDAKIDLTDTSTEPPFSDTFAGTDVHMTLSKKKGGHFSFVTHSSRPSSSLKIEGDYSFVSQKLTAKIIAQQMQFSPHLYMILPEAKWRFFEGLLNNGQVDLSWKNGDVELTGDCDGNIDLMIYTARPKRVQGNVIAKNFHLKKQNDKVDVD